MKFAGFDLKKRLVSKYLYKDLDYNNSKSTNINILLNRVRLSQKIEKRKKFFFFSSCFYMLNFIWDFDFSIKFTKNITFSPNNAN